VNTGDTELLPGHPRAGYEWNRVSELEKLYRSNWKFVRDLLQALGVGAKDLDDLSHEIFLVASRKLPEARLDSSAEHRWLRRITQYVVLGYRRRAFRRFELRSTELDELASVPAMDMALTEREDTDLLHVALSRLDPDDADVLALHTVGQLSFRTLAEISDCDPKTARRKFIRALGRARLLLNDPKFKTSLMPEPSTPWASRPLGEGVDAGSVATLAPDLDLELLDECVAVAVSGRTAISVWRGTITDETLDRFLIAARRIRSARGGPFPYLAIVEKTCKPPGFSARTKLLEMLRVFRDDVTAYATVPSASSFTLQIMSALAVLARVPFPMRFFGNVEEASRWLFDAAGASSGLESASDLIQAAHQLRLLAGNSEFEA
jgi:RNA polymerase sigma factor (sigma-70 family)